MLEVCSGVTNEKEKDGVYKGSDRTLVRGAKSDGSSAMCTSKVASSSFGIADVGACHTVDT